MLEKQAVQTTGVVQVSAGTGPVEVRRFVKLIGARLLARCRALGMEVLGVDVRGDGEAPGSIAIRVGGDLTLLADEAGTHALVARSGGRGRASRKRWFAGVAIVPAAEALDTRVDARDLVVTAARAGGPGGQNVNKVASAVRVVHRPSGVAVRVADERSQHMNRRRAARRIEEVLAARADVARSDESASRRMEHYRFSRGAPVRVYRLDRRGALEVVETEKERC